MTSRDVRGSHEARRSAESRFERLGETVVFDGHVITVSVATFADGHGGTFTRDLLHHPGAVAVVPVHDDGSITLVRQFRTALGHELLEIPAGIRDVPGEDPRTTAARELAEEVGLAADEITLLNRFHNAAGYADEEIFVFEARGLHEVGSDVQGPEEQAMTIERHSLADCVAMVADGEVTDAKTIIAVLLLAARA